MKGATMPPTEKIDVHVRWMIRKDMPAVLGIENAVYAVPWTEEEFIKALRQRNCTGKVAVSGNQVVGFFIYDLHSKFLRLANVAVHPEFQRRGVGKAMTLDLIRKLSPCRRHTITLMLAETNLRAQLFFRSMGFVCTGICKEPWPDRAPGDDGYVFEFRVD